MDVVYSAHQRVAVVGRDLSAPFSWPGGKATLLTSVKEYQIPSPVLLLARMTAGVVNMQGWQLLLC